MIASSRINGRPAKKPFKLAKQLIPVPDNSEISELSPRASYHKLRVINQMRLASRVLLSSAEGLHSMTLRIQKSVERERVVLTLTGRIQAAQVPELLALLRSEPSTHGIVLDLEQVKLVDRDAVLFLALSEALGARLRNCSAYIREWINQERNAHRSVTEGPTESER